MDLCLAQQTLCKTESSVSVWYIDMNYTIVVLIKRLGDSMDTFYRGRAIYVYASIVYMHNYKRIKCKYHSCVCLYKNVLLTTPYLDIQLDRPQAMKIIAYHWLCDGHNVRRLEQRQPHIACPTVHAVSKIIRVHLASAESCTPFALWRVLMFLTFEFCNTK